MEKDPTVLEAKRYEIFCCREDDSLLVACRKMVVNDISSLVVVNQPGYLAGIITRTDMLRANQDYTDWTTVPVGAMMNHEVITVTPDTTLSTVCMMLLQYHIHRVVVVREEDGLQRPVAVVSNSDMVYHMLHGGAGTC